MIMYKVKEKEPINNHQDDSNHDLEAKILQIYLNRQERIKNLTPPCPDCSHPGKYHQEKSGYYGGKLVYECDNNHQFFWSFAKQRGKLIPR